MKEGINVIETKVGDVVLFEPRKMEAKVELINPVNEGDKLHARNKNKNSEQPVRVSSWNRDENKGYIWIHIKKPVKKGDEVFKDGSYDQPPGGGEEGGDPSDDGSGPITICPSGKRRKRRR